MGVQFRRQKKGLWEKPGLSPRPAPVSGDVLGRTRQPLQPRGAPGCERQAHTPARGCDVQLPKRDEMTAEIPGVGVFT